MSDAEVRRRKKLQGHISQATGGLGLTALGGTLLATKTGNRLGSKALKAVKVKRVMPAPEAITTKFTAPVLATSAGIGGAGSFNFASYTGAEAKKRQRLTAVPVKKKKKKETISHGYTLEFSKFDAEGIAKRYEDGLPTGKD
jgi:hypothetical protein